MNMRADLLACLSCPEYSDYRHFGLLMYLRRVDIASQQRITAGGDTLIMVDAVKSYAKEIHGKVIPQAGGRQGLPNVAGIVPSRKK